MKTGIASRIIAACTFALGASAAQAAYVLNSQNVTFTLSQLSPSQLVFEISGAPDATGDWASATHLGAFEFQGGNGLGINWGAPGVSATAFYEPVGPNSNGQNMGLNANGCGGGSPSHAICFTWAPQLMLADVMKFTITIAGAVLDLGELSTPHLKIQFTNAQGKKVGDLLSQDMPWQNEPGQPVPLPGMLALLGVGMLGLGFGSRRRPC